MYSDIISSLESKITLTIDNVILELQNYFIVKKDIGKSINKCFFDDVCNSIGMALGSNVSENDIKEYYYNLYKKIDKLNKKEILELLDEVKKLQKYKWSDSAIIPKDFLDIMFREKDKTKEVFFCLKLKSREYINNNYKINLIYLLTSNVFKPNVMINTYFMEFTTGRTEGIEAKIIDKDKNGFIFEKNEKLIFKEELEEINNWHIDLLLTEKSNEMLAYENSEIRKECIRDIAMVLKGKTITRKDDNGNIKVINISNLNNGEIDYSDLESISDDLIKNSRYILENGDILVSARGTIIKIGIFKQQSFVCIASSNLNIIRCNKEIDSMYLKIFLESHVGKELLKSIERGSSLLNINYKDIEEIKVPVLSYVEQKEIVDEYVKAKNSYNAMVEEATKEWEFAKDNVERKFYR